MRPLIRRVAPWLLAPTLFGCATTTLRSGKPPGHTAPGLNQAWHAAFVFGTIEGIRSYDLERLCPGGWAEVRVEPDPLTLLAGASTLFMYSPSRVTVVCALRPGDDPASF